MSSAEFVCCSLGNSCLLAREPPSGFRHPIPRRQLKSVADDADEKDRKRDRAMPNTIDIVVIQTSDKCVNARDKDSCEGYLSKLSNYYRNNGAFTVQDTSQFIYLMMARVAYS